MAKVLVTESNLSDIADAIRTKNGQSSATYTPTQMAPAILAIPAGGGAPSLQNKTVTPSASQQVVSADSGYDGLNQVTVSGDADLVASNIKHDVNIFNVAGTFGMKIDSVTATPSSRGTSITFTGLKAQPIAFDCQQEAQTTISKSYRMVVSVNYDGTTVRNITYAVSGSSMITYTYTNVTFSYNNGTLTLTSPSAGANGYFNNTLHRLVYIYEE